MNLERWVRQRKKSWQKLEAILAGIDKFGMAGLSKEELRQLGRLYRATSADLSRARSFMVDRQLESYINNLVVRAHNQVYQNTNNRLIDLLRFLWVEFPNLVLRYFAYVLAAVTLFVLPLIGSYVATNSDLNFARQELFHGDPLVPDHIWSTVEKRELWTGGIQNFSPLAASQIVTNNIHVSIVAFALGITFGVGTAIVLIFNGISLGTIFGVCHNFGIARNLLAFVAPHGVLELTAIFISGGAGLLIGKALLFPGNYSRIDSLKLAAKPALGLFGGCIPLLIIAACIEGFVSPRTDVSLLSRYWLSLTTFVLLSLYFFIPRRTAAVEIKTEHKDAQNLTKI
ncbi:MAG: stage II sporulation protein M [Candidatus Obscuribacterales bacterium]|nr:stage II sporulation protein M [Candidatus Obscuribacterales bacterium]